jgi:hypothetical protein
VIPGEADFGFANITGGLSRNCKLDPACGLAVKAVNDHALVSAKCRSYYLLTCR